MGVVFRATDESLDREVAIKVLHPQLLQNSHIQDRFRREARMHARILHPNIVTMLSLYDEGGQMAIIMEMVHGYTLRQYMRSKKRLPLSETVRISLAVLAGLEEAHKQGMVHRDLKPANVMLSDSGVVKLMDFGLAKPEKGEEDLTQSGATVGSFRYMAPEQILNQPIDARTDIYSFGILLYQMVTGKLPFDSSPGAGSGGEFEIMEKQVRHEPAAPSQLNPALPPEMEALILRMLAKHPDKRPANCAEVRQLLMQIAARLPAEEVMSSSPFTLPNGVEDTGASRVATSLREPAKSNRKLPVLPLAAAGAALLALLGWFVVAGGKGDSTDAEPPVQPEPPVAMAAKPEPKPEAAPAAKPVAAPRPQPVAKPETKPAAKPVPTAKAEAKPPGPAAAAPVRSSGSKALASVGYSVKRSDSTSAAVDQKHEFSGGSVTLFEELRDYRWKETLRTVKNGWTRLYLEAPIAIGSITLHRATVGGLDFAAGSVELEVQVASGRWHSVLLKKGEDVSRSITVKLPPDLGGEFKGVRVSVKSPEPIVIGPIDLK